MDMYIKKGEYASLDVELDFPVGESDSLTFKVMEAPEQGAALISKDVVDGKIEFHTEDTNHIPAGVYFYDFVLKTEDGYETLMDGLFVIERGVSIKE